MRRADQAKARSSRPRAKRSGPSPPGGLARPPGGLPPLAGGGICYQPQRWLTPPAAQGEGFSGRSGHPFLRHSSKIKGRTIIASDRPLLDRLVAGGSDATFEELALQVAMSRQFRYRRGLEDRMPVELAKGE